MVTLLYSESMEFVIKTATTADIWWAIGREMSFLPLIDPAFSPERMNVVQRVLLRTTALPLNYRRCNWKWIVWAENQRVGFQFSRRKGDSIHIESMGVEPNWRRKGVAIKLIDEVEVTATKSDCNYLTGAITPENQPAQKLLRTCKFRPFRTQLLEGDREAVNETKIKGADIHELGPADALPAYERWQRHVIKKGDAWAEDLMLDLYLRSGWKGAARHWIGLYEGQEAGYLRLSGLNGKYQAYLACSDEFWQNPIQVAWIQQAVKQYPYPLISMGIELAGNEQFEISAAVWESRGYRSINRARHLMIKRL